MSETVTVRVSHRFTHPPETVFDAWLTPATAKGFLFATPQGTMVRAQIDPRVGGRFIFTDRRDGQDIDHVGEYLEIDRPRRLVFSFKVPAFSDQGTVVAIDITPAPGGCELTLTHQGVLPDYRDRTIEGWTGILAKLAEGLG